MGLDYKHLTHARIRPLMEEEIDRDIAADTLYKSKNFTERGRADYAELMRAAIKGGTDDTLADEISTGMRFKPFEKPRVSIKGTPYTPKLRETAEQMFAEGEFNNFYMRALCRLAMESGIAEVEIYRAKPVAEERPGSPALIGKHKSAEPLLERLRTNARFDKKEDFPQGANSGLSVKLPE